MQPSSIVIRIPSWHPAKINQWDGRHWAVRRGLKKKDLALLSAYCVGSPKAQVKRRVRLTIWLKKRQRAGDPDAYWKSLLDGLVHCGQLVDDNRQGVELMPVQFHRDGHDDEGNPWWGTEIELAEMEERTHGLSIESETKTDKTEQR